MFFLPKKLFSTLTVILGIVVVSFLFSSTVEAKEVCDTNLRINGNDSRECVAGNNCTGRQFTQYDSYDDDNGNGQIDSGETVYCTWRSDCSNPVTCAGDHQCSASESDIGTPAKTGCNAGNGCTGTQYHVYAATDDVNNKYYCTWTSCGEPKTCSATATPTRPAGATPTRPAGTTPTSPPSGSCSLGTNTFGMNETCSSCITSKNTGLVAAIKKLGSDNGQTWGGCTNNQLIGKWCAEIDRNGCNSYKNGDCAASCGGTNPTATPPVNPSGTPTATPTVNPSVTPSATPTPTPPSVTTHFRVSESRFGRGDEGANSPQWMEFQDEDGGDPVTISYKFANAKAGDELTLFVQYKNDKEKTEVYQKTIKYIGPNPVITSASCSYDPSGEGTLVTLIGSNFGGHDEQGAGGVKINGQQADIISWVPEEPVPTVEPSPTPTPVVCGGIAGKTCPTGFKCEIPDKTIPDASGKCVPEKDKNDDKVCAQVITSAKNPDGTQCKDFPTPCDVPSGWVKVASCSGVGSGTVLGGEASQSRVIAKIKDKMPGKVRIPLLLTLDDGRVALTSSNGTPTCTVNTTTVQFAAKVGCRSSGNFSLSDVNVNITELVSGAKPSVKQKLSLDKDGNLPSDFIPLLEKGKKYKLVVKAPKTVARKIEFTPAEGSNILPEVSLPIGDIAPAGNPDGKINVSDRSQIVREWSSANDTAKAGDLNLDGRVNSLDWSCMRENFNKEDEDKIQ